MNLGRFRADSRSAPEYNARMSLSEVLACLPELTLSERHTLIRRALELDDPGLSAADEALVEGRLADHRRDPASALSLEEMKARLRSRSGK
jgi:putative addiction module component (TIGR02574 family)